MTTDDLNHSRWSGRRLHHAGTFLSVIAVLGLILVVAWLSAQNIDKEIREKQATDRLSVIETDGKRLAESLDAQRKQFATCANKPVGAPGCVTPVAPPAANVAPTVVTGGQGALGAQGLLGPPGERGPTGSTGGQGQSGTNGIPGGAGPTGTTGMQGSAGVKGELGSAGAAGAGGAPGTKGDPGPTGPSGADGAPGAAGAPGSPGADGLSAYPFTFVFTAGESTFTCTLTAPDKDAACTTPTTAPPTP